MPCASPDSRGAGESPGGAGGAGGPGGEGGLSGGGTSHEVGHSPTRGVPHTIAKAHTDSRRAIQTRRMSTDRTDVPRRQCLKAVRQKRPSQQQQTSPLLESAIDTANAGFSYIGYQMMLASSLGFMCRPSRAPGLCIPAVNGETSPGLIHLPKFPSRHNRDATHFETMPSDLRPINQLYLWKHQQC